MPAYTASAPYAKAYFNFSGLPAGDNNSGTMVEVNSLKDFGIEFFSLYQYSVKPQQFRAIGDILS
jgi:hypothetical protein